MLCGLLNADRCPGVRTTLVVTKIPLCVLLQDMGLMSPSSLSEDVVALEDSDEATCSSRVLETVDMVKGGVPASAGWPADVANWLRLQGTEAIRRRLVRNLGGRCGDSATN